MATAFRMRAQWVLVLAAVAALVLPAIAATLKPGFTEVTIASGLTEPDGHGVRARRAPVRLPAGRAVARHRERRSSCRRRSSRSPSTRRASAGLLGVAFDPNFPSNQFVYVYYTATSPTIHNRVSRFTANGNVAVAGSESVLLDLPTLSATNHNGGAMHFGPDGKLYIAVGRQRRRLELPDARQPAGQDAAHQRATARSRRTTRSSARRRASTGQSGRSGLRNPFTFAFQPTSGRMFINDVGQNTWEEINDGAAGANYGWPDYRRCRRPIPPL